MIDNRKNPWYYIIPLVLGFMLGGTAGWLLGNHPVAGGFIGWAVATALFLFVGGPAKPTSTLNGLALLAILGLPSWYWLLAALFAFAVLVAVGYVLYAVGRMCWRFSLRW